MDLRLTHDAKQAWPYQSQYYSLENYWSLFDITIYQLDWTKRL